MNLKYGVWYTIFFLIFFIPPVIIINFLGILAGGIFLLFYWVWLCRNKNFNSWANTKYEESER